MRYRPEIDGLRTLAVLPVILFHAGFSLFRGGYVGVDVFFVISGYLISSLIVSELKAGSFSFGGFYERRARRILPALLLVSIVCVPFAWVSMLPVDLADFSKSLLAVSGFVSNIFFWRQSGYFDQANELKPLLHTWSLAVEEQFYLIFPLFLVLALRWAKKWTTALFAIGLAASFGLAIWAGYRTPVASFYLLPTRIWEMLLGALVSLALADGRAPVSIRRVPQEILGILGFVLIAWSATSGQEGVFPNLPVIAATIGALLIILFVQPGTIIGKLLGSRAFVGVGLISYSAYLWHQPIFAFARLLSFSEPSSLVFFALIALTLGAAYFTWRFVERPFRDRRILARSTFFATTGLATGALIAFAATGVLTRGFEGIYLSRIPDARTQAVYDLVKHHASRDIYADMGDDGDCVFWSRSIDVRFETRFRGCVVKYKTATLVIGDSHAMNIFNALFRSGFGHFIVSVSDGGCRPNNKAPECLDLYSGLDAFLKQNKEAVGLIIYHQSGAHLLKDASGNVDNPRLFDYGRNFTVFTEAIDATFDYLNGLSVLTRVIWLGPFPEARVNLNDIGGLARRGLTMNPVALDLFTRLDREIDRHMVNRADRKFEFIPFAAIAEIKPDFLLVGDCLTYRDFDHLSACGEKLIGERLKQKLGTSN